MHDFKRTRRLDSFGLLALVAGLVLVGGLVDNSFHRSVATAAMIHAVAAVGLTLLLGYAGQISLGQGTFVGVGAYASAYFVQKLGIDPLVGIFVGMTIAGGLAYGISRPLLRLKGHYLAMATMALGTGFYIAASQAGSVTGGLDPGIVQMPLFAPFGRRIDSHAFYWVAAVGLVVATAIALNIAHSRVGRGLKALHGSEVAAASLGVDVSRYKALVFALAAMMAAVSGSLFAFETRSFNAGAFGFGLSVELLMMVIIGSLSTVWGALFGAAFITVMPMLLEDFEAVKPLVYGLLMVAIMVLMPNGMADAAVSAAMRRLRRTKGSAR